MPAVSNLRRSSTSPASNDSPFSVPSFKRSGRLREGREIARRLGLHITGVLGVLLRAKRMGQIVAIKPELMALRERARFFVSNELEARILEAANE